MAFDPFMQSKTAQDIINNHMNAEEKPAGMYRNPMFDIRTEQENAGTLDPSALYPNPQIDFSVPEEEIIDPCQEGFMLVDGICQPIETFGQSLYTGDDEDTLSVDTRTKSEKMYDEMKKDTSVPFGANRELDKYSAGFDKDGNEIFKYEDKGYGFNVIGLLDGLFGGKARRQKRYNDSTSTILGQTQSDFYKNKNPFAFGYQDGNQFTKFNNQNYLDRVQDEIVKGSNQGATMGDLLGSVGQTTLTGDNAPTQQVNQGGQGTQTSDNSNYMMQDNGKRDESAYEAAIAKNIARNLSNRDSTTGQKKSTASTGSGFSKSLGGFYKGR
jgi:hypothetical protein